MRFFVFSISILNVFFLFAKDVKSQKEKGIQSATEVRGVINVYTPVIEILEPCAREIIVKSSSGFYTGDKVLIIQMQGAVIDSSNSPLYGSIQNRNNSGNCEFSRITKISGDKITLRSPLVNAYSLNGKVQLVRVPEYDDVATIGELTCTPWNGNIGGILVLCVFDTLFMNNDINVSGKGFRGGIAYGSANFPNYYVSDYSIINTLPGYGASKGEGVAQFGVFPYVNGRGSPANGGGGGGNHNAGGAGGGNVGCGGDGGEGWISGNYSGSNKDAQSIGGKSLDYSMQGVFMGGGGGAGHSNQYDVGKGGNGGGIVIVIAGAISTRSFTRIFADGETGEESNIDGSGGSGAGGAVYLDVGSIKGSISVSVQGADGANNLCTMYDVPPGGGGGGGAIIYPSAKKPIQSSMSGGKSGKTMQGNTYGAKDGCTGRIFENRRIMENTEQALYINVHNDTVICLGDSVVLSNHSNNESYTYSWYPSDFLNDPTIANPIATPSRSITYCVEIKKDNCVVSDCITITIVEPEDNGFRIEVQDSSNISIGSIIPVIVTIPKGLENPEFGIAYDEYAVAYQHVYPKDFTDVSVGQQKRGYLDISTGSTQNSERKIVLMFRVLLPRNKSRVTTFNLINSTASTNCRKIGNNYVDIEILPTCAWNIRGVHGSEKFDIQTDGEKLYFHTGIGGRTKLSIYDMRGEEVWQMENNYSRSSEVEIPFPELPKGVFIIRVQNYTYKKDIVIYR